jgi:uncharacterized protein YecE (DUF72 family)
MKAYVGTSGFQYRGWAGDFYPEGLPQRRWLEHYAQRFNTVEINSTFYRLPGSKTFDSWRERTPDGFVFSLKGSQYITHRERLRSATGSVARFFERASALGPKLGVVLWQFPENFAPGWDRLREFCEILAQHPVAGQVPQAFELRHPDWFTERTYETLHVHDYALVISQSSVWPQVKVTTAGWGYWRFHGPGALYSSGYSDEQLADWAQRIRGQVAGDFYAYFNNDNGNFAPKNAARLRELVN